MPGGPTDTTTTHPAAGRFEGSARRVLVVDYAGHPFQYDLSCELGARGHQVVHSYSSSTPTPQAGFSPSANVDVRPVSIGRPFERYRPLRRLIDEIQYGLGTVRVAHRFRPDRVLTSNVPLVSLVLIWLWSSLTRTRWVWWLQDFQSGLAVMADASGLVSRCLGLIERFLLRRADHVVVISAAFADDVATSGVDPDRVTVIENWAPLDAMPVRPRDNAWSDAHGLADRFVFLYAGTLGIKHSPELLVELAREFEHDDDVAVVAVGEGPGADWLSDQPVPRPMQLPFQPFEQLPDVLGSADVLVVLLDPAAGTYSVPSKTLSYLCAGRPLLASIPAENLAAELVATRAEAGIVTPAGDGERFRRAARRLRESEAERTDFARKARCYAEASFGRREIADRFERVLMIGTETPQEINPHG